jgi:predicted DNA-binding ribbon-helix-helix protein
MKDIAASQRLSIRDLVSKIDSERKHGNLSSALRIFVLNHYPFWQVANMSDRAQECRERAL